ncbi:phage holin family protein [Streptomyces fenghuangensis]|uniref:Phage holin family protein n=1 Tax=Streptomyces chitinivorans TaxID=1257027 RepID=A0ABW7HXM2_9ACTN|nr:MULTISPECIES: phage holin family protein [Streptomyces]MCG3041415.1 phage holin family protein [Streptomyces sp. ICN903]MDH2411998.1 phage holin family protein [Streptomyces chitinivorans]
MAYTAHRPDTDLEARGRTTQEDASIGELLSAVTSDAQKLFRQEVELAKAEIREEATKAGKAAGMYGGAGFAGYMTVLFASLALTFGLANVMDWGWAALIVTVLWGVAAAVMYVMGRSKMKQVHPKPERTVQTLKEDAEWARHPTS